MAGFLLPQVSHFAMSTMQKHMKTAILIVVLGIMTAWVAAGGPVDSTAPDFNQVVIPVGKGPGSIAIADVNHDGKPDIIVANTEDGTVSVLLGDGRGHFRPAPGSPFPCTGNPTTSRLRT